jgi:type IV secretory pathway VirB9-like protein
VHPILQTLDGKQLFLRVEPPAVELNGNVNAFTDGQNHEDLFHFQVDNNEGTEEDNSYEVEDNGKDLLDDDESVYRYPDEPAYYEAAEDEAAEAAEAAATAAAEAAQAEQEKEEGNWHLAVLRGLDEATALPMFDGGFHPTYSSGEDEDETGESKQEKEVDDVDIQTALRCRRMMTHPDGSYSDYDEDDDDEEVAESQALF